MFLLGAGAGLRVAWLKTGVRVQHGPSQGRAAEDKSERRREERYPDGCGHEAMSYPASSIAARTAPSSIERPVTLTRLLSRSTTTDSTPSTCSTSPVTAPTQCSQLTPGTEKLSSFWFVIATRALIRVG